LFIEVLFKINIGLLLPDYKDRRYGGYLTDDFIHNITAL